MRGGGVPHPGPRQHLPALVSTIAGLHCLDLIQMLSLPAAVPWRQLYTFRPLRVQPPGLLL